MRVYFDSSVFAKRYLYEPGTDVVLAWCEKARELVLSVQFLRFFAQRLTEEYLLKQQFIMSFDVVRCRWRVEQVEKNWSKWRHGDDSKHALQAACPRRMVW